MLSDLSLDLDKIIPNMPVGTLKIDEKYIDELKDYTINNSINLSKKEYRDKINRLYNDIGNVKPIDNIINNVLYFDNYEEVGLVLNKKNISLKQIWTEYRLIYNEKKKDDNIMGNSFVLDNFDELFGNITKKVDGVDKYIEELNSMKKEVDNNSSYLKERREAFELEKFEFEEFCKKQKELFAEKEQELNEKLSKVNELMNDLDKKINSLLNIEE